MKRRLWLGSLILCAVFLVGFMSCASFEKNTFKSLYGTASIYNMGMVTVSTLQKSGTISAEQRVVANKAAVILKASITTAVNSFRAWKLSPNKAAEEELQLYLNSSLAGIVTSFNEWQKVINTFVPNTIQGNYKLQPGVEPKAVTEFEDKNLKKLKGTFPPLSKKESSSLESGKKGIDPATISVIVSAIGIIIQYGMPQISALFENMGKSSITIEDIDGILILLKDPETY